MRPGPDATSRESAFHCGSRIRPAQEKKSEHPAAPNGHTGSNVPHTTWWSRTIRKPDEPARDDVVGTDAERHDAFAALVERQSRFVFRVAYSVLRNTADAEDAVQETFLKLYRTGAWERMDDEKAFLARAAWRMAVDRLPRRDVGEDSASALDELPTMGQSPEQAAVGRDSTAMLHRMIDSLPEDLRQPLALSALQELNSREITAVMGINEGTVRTRLMRAREMLKAKLAARLDNSRLESSRKEKPE